jgi:hypothetical protein
MVKKAISKSYHSVNYTKFINVAENFQNAAELALEFDYFNAAGVLFIHSAIAYADAITTKFASKKSSGDNHYMVINLIEEILPPIKIDKKSFNNFKLLIDHKNSVSYSGDIYNKKDVEKIKNCFLKFSFWAKNIINP